MNANQSRRDFVVAAGVAAVGTTALSSTSAIAALTKAAATASPAAGSFSYQTLEGQVAALVARTISSVDLVEQSIARIEALDGRVNAVVVRDFSRARGAAKRADAALSRGERRPLLGIPVTVKEAFNVGGLPTTWGMPVGRDWRPDEDAVVVARLKSAGAVILGKTNVPFGLADWQSYNSIYGTTNNPWDLTRTPGGSSGGSAAAIAAGYVALEVGSDLAGSLRCPAHFCGVFCHKPSYGIVPSRGHTPPNAEPLQVDATGELAVVGPIARSAADLALALDVLAGPDERESIAYRFALPPARHDKLKGYRVLLVDAHPLERTSQTIRAALDRLADRLVKVGTSVKRSSPLLPNLAEATRIYQRLFSPAMTSRMPPEFYRQMEAVVASLSAGDNSLKALYMRGALASHRDWLEANVARARLRKQWQALFREWDVVLCPPMPTPAFPHDHSQSQTRLIDIDGTRYAYGDMSVWPSLATGPGLPATVAPIDRSESGLPIGVQIIGPYLEDRTTMRFAQFLEREFGGFVPPAKI